MHKKAKAEINMKTKNIIELKILINTIIIKLFLEFIMDFIFFNMNKVRIEKYLYFLLMKLILKI